MPAHIKVIHAHEFIKATPEGELDINESKKLLLDIALTAGSLVDFEIILDTRKAHSILTITELWYLSKELSKFHKMINHKIAVVCPQERFDYAGFFALCSENNGFRINAFTSLENALEWLMLNEQLIESPSFL
jgi:hypothetical protein